MRKLFSLFLALVATTALWADKFKVDGIHYNTLNESEVEVTYVGFTYDSYPNGYSGSVTIPETVTFNRTTYSVTSIGYGAFYDCSTLTSVTIPNSVTSIGNRAFAYCRSLTSITIPNSVTSIGGEAFYYCWRLTSITIPESVTSIGGGAFADCDGLPVENNLRYADTYLVEAVDKTLSTYSIKEGTKWIGSYAFEGCSGLTSITIPNSVTSIGDHAFRECSGLTSVILGSGVTSIGSWAFEYCSGLTSITIPNSVTSIGSSAFENCSSLTSITIPNSVTSIGSYAFEYCSGLTSVTIGNSVTSIGWEAFAGCKSLTSVVWNVKNCADFSSSSYAPFSSQITSFTFGDSVEYIPAYLCCGMSKLTSITIPNSVTSIGERAFCECSSLTSVTLGSGVTSIGSWAFYNCSSLTSITIPNSVTSIGYEAFYECKGLTSVVWNAENYADGSKPFYDVRSQITSFTFGDSVEHIPADLCYGMSKLTSITIPNSVTSIGSSAFSSCSGLKSIESLAEVPPTLGTNAFYKVSTQIPVYVACGSVSAYKYAYGWKTFTKIQEPLAEHSIAVDVNDNKMGTAKVDENIICGAQISATANYGYHFVQWSDGVTDNPRTLVLTQDTAFTAEFAINQYSITTTSSHAERGTTQGDTTVNYLEYTTISATANYGYHFTKWDDGNKDNPRVVQVTEDKTYTAYFDKNTYSITKQYDAEQGSITGPTSGKYLDVITLTATPKYGYHFTQWNDGVTTNPRSFVLTKDTAFTAEFAINQYSITTTSSHAERGTTQGDTTVNYLEEVTISATSNYGYHFTQWNDGNTDNPRIVKVTGDKTYTAYFNKNTYIVSVDYNSAYGTVTGPTSGEYMDELTLTATPKTGYHFVQWGDGNTDNPRSIVLTQDTTFTAEFAQSFSGQCGDNLYWDYDEANKKISITGSGNMYDYTKSTQPWLLFQEQITEVTTSNTTTSIGTSAFEGCIRLGKISLGCGMENIAANAFTECKRLYDVYVYATNPPFAEESSFANYNVYLYIPCENQRDYILDVVWGKFKYIECIGAESDDTGGDDVTITPGTNDVTITWPTENNAYTYTIVIKKDGEVVCTLTFNADGQLLNIAFAPGRQGNHPAQYAEQANNGYRFTVTGLEEGTDYTYTVTSKDAANKTISEHSGKFTTNSATALDNTHSQSTNCQKILRNGQLIILRDGVEYNAMGQEL